MNPDYWLKRWQDGKIGWHQSEADPALATWAKELPAASRVLVPLCGKSLDLKYLMDQGHEVIGIELSSQACEQFFAENKIPVQTAIQGAIKVYTSISAPSSVSTRPGPITILNGDIFKVTPELLGKVNALYDRAALIAMPPALRDAYVTKILSLTEPARMAPFSFLQIVLSRTPSDEVGPPFSVSEKEVRRLYGDHFELHQQSKEFVEATAPEGSKTEEIVFHLIQK